MTRKDYELIAQVLKQAKPMLPDNPNRHDKIIFGGEDECWNDIIRRFGITLSRDNPQFKISKFEKACGRI